MCRTRAAGGRSATSWAERCRSPASARRRCCRTTAIRDRFTQVALEPVGSTQEQFAKLVREDYDKYARLIRELAIRAD
jgi:hypothetical protein